MSRRDGQQRYIESLASEITEASGSEVGTVMVFRDVSERVRLHREMIYRATHDALTGALNRDEFERRVQMAVRTTHACGTHYALMYIDLDRFKLVNDAGGHAAGDRLLKQVAGLITRHSRPGDTVARVGGDEFGLLIEQCAADDGMKMAQRICEELDAFRFREGDLYLHVGASIGLVMLDLSWVSAENILRAADSACYAAKAAGRNRVHLYTATDELIESQHEDMQWARRLEMALDNLSSHCCGSKSAHSSRARTLYMARCCCD
ncbi:diguanylate cyclase domain-containing protein [Paraburkholderia xenovorans]|uniref:diguanylate cyclase domain-containing protein n=1 Tax=Paraburkholderia xenovorans TaxID=36873 RepID=UPI00068FB03B|nr:diguanylate cyclase [Paraburkholderia xenovorans]